MRRQAIPGTANPAATEIDCLLISGAIAGRSLLAGSAPRAIAPAGADSLISGAIAGRSLLAGSAPRAIAPAGADSLISGAIAGRSLVKSYRIFATLGPA